MDCFSRPGQNDCSKLVSRLLRVTTTSTHRNVYTNIRFAQRVLALIRVCVYWPAIHYYYYYYDISTHNTHFIIQHKRVAGRPCLTVNHDRYIERRACTYIEYRYTHSSDPIRWY